MTSFRIPGTAHAPHLPAPNLAEQIQHADTLATIIERMPSGLNHDAMIQRLLPALSSAGLTLTRALHTLAADQSPSPRVTARRV